MIKLLFLFSMWIIFSLIKCNLLFLKDYKNTKQCSYPCLFEIDTQDETLQDITYMLELKNNLLVIGNRSGFIRIIDPVNDYNIINTFKAHSSDITSILELENGNLATSSIDATIKIWACSNNYQLVKTLVGHLEPVTALVEYKGYIVSTSKEIKLWDSKTYEYYKSIRTHSNFIYHIILDGENNFIYTFEDHLYIKWVGFFETYEIYNNFDYYAKPTLLNKGKILISKRETHDYISFIFNPFSRDDIQVLSNILDFSIVLKSGVIAGHFMRNFREHFLVFYDSNNNFKMLNVIKLVDQRFDVKMNYFLSLRDGRFAASSGSNIKIFEYQY